MEDFLFIVKAVFPIAAGMSALLFFAPIVIHYATLWFAYWGVK